MNDGSPFVELVCDLSIAIACASADERVRSVSCWMSLQAIR